MSVEVDDPITEADGLFELGLYAKRFTEGDTFYLEMFKDIPEEEVKMAIHWRYCTNLGVVFNAIVEDWTIEEIHEFIKKDMKSD